MNNLVAQQKEEKSTTHWINFMRPLMWRSKWTELRIKELESQASKYARFISSHNRRKQIALDQTLVEQLGSKSLPFTHQRPRKVSLKRRKRIRAEDTTDTASYMSNHNLFTEPENKRSDIDKLLGWEDLDNSDNIMTRNEAAEVERSMSTNKHDQPTEKTRDTENDLEEHINNATQYASDPHSVAKAVASEERSTLKPCLVLELHFPKNKRKRGERKAGSGNWSRQGPGEPCG